MNCKLCGNFINQNFYISDLWNFKCVTNKQLCDNCLDMFVKIKKLKCPFCSRLQKNNEICNDCFVWNTKENSILKNKALYQYNFQMKSYIKKYKYDFDYELKDVFKKEFTNFIKDKKDTVYIVIPNKNKRRQFNQVLELIDHKKIKPLDILKLKENVLKIPQAKKSRKERLLSTQPFYVIESNTQKIVNKKIILIDDVYTTGVTLRHAMYLLNEFKPKEIGSITLCR